MYDMGGKLLNGINSMYVNSLAYAEVKVMRVSISGLIVMCYVSYVSCPPGFSVCT